MPKVKSLASRAASKRGAFESAARFTNIEMEWNDTGAIINATTPIRCPVCDYYSVPETEHRCGSFAALTESAKPKPKRAAKAKESKS